MKVFGLEGCTVQVRDITMGARWKGRGACKNYDIISGNMVAARLNELPRALIAIISEGTFMNIYGPLCD